MKEGKSMQKMLATLIIIMQMISAWTIYPETMVVTRMDRQTDIVTMENSGGMVFEMYGCEDYEVGDTVSAIMYNAGDQRTCKDDIILGAHNGGFRIEDFKH